MSPSPRSRSPLDGSRFLAICGGILLLTSLPYLYRLARLPANHRLLGGDYRNLGDIYTYVAWMKQAAQGHTLFLLLYDPAPQKRSLFLPFFLVLGWLGRLLDLDLMLVLHLARVACSALLLLAARLFCRTLLTDPELQLRAFLLLVLGSGLPALIPEACPFSSMFDSALFAFSWAVMLFAAAAWWRACHEGSLLGAAMTGLCGATLILTHPYDAVSIAALCAATTIVLWTRPGFPAALARLGIVAASMTPAAGIVVWSFRQNPRLQAWAGAPRNTILWEVLLSFGSLLILSGAAIFGRRYRERGIDPLVVAWVASSFVLMLAPVPSQRRYIQGLMAPLAILGAQGFRILHHAGLKRLANHAFACAFPASAVMLGVDMSEIIPNIPHSMPYADVEDLARLETLPDGIILAQPGIDYFVPAFAGRQVYAGHWEQTPQYKSRAAFFDAFQKGQVEGGLLAAKGIRWVVMDKFAPTRDWPGLRDVRTGNRIRIYEVVAPRS